MAPRRGGRGRARPSGGTLTADSLLSPIDTPGNWVAREEFHGNKSFGAFECGCNKVWLSAHAYTNYSQRCKRCEAESLPSFMWVNTDNGERREKAAIDKNKPHDRERCEACRLDVCTMDDASTLPCSMRGMRFRH